MTEGEPITKIDPLTPKPDGELEHEELAQIVGIEKRREEEFNKKFLETIKVLGSLSRRF